MTTVVDAIAKLFPGISKSNLEITSPETSRYNCIAWAAGDTGRWWWPDSLGLGYWPPKVPRVMTIAAFQFAFESIGFQLREKSEILENDVEKVAIFHKEGMPTHAARQLTNGLWTSKLGNSFDITHNLRGLEGSLYGNIALIMQRPMN